MFEYVCELCGRQVKDGEKFSVLMTEQVDESYGEGVEGADEICKNCADTIEECISSLRR